MGRDIDLRDLAPKQRDMGNTARSHYGGIGEIHQQTRSLDTAEQKMKKSNQLGTMRMRTFSCDVDLGQQATDRVDECVHAHSGYPDHHFERIFKTITTTIEKDKSMKIIRGDFIAEFGPGEGIELSAVGHYTLNKANCRGEWMTQWLLQNSLVALNTMYKKIPQKQMTLVTPKNGEKQLDYILTDSKHYSWSKDAEANDKVHTGSDHRCVMAKFEIPKERGKPRHSKTPATERGGDISDDEQQHIQGVSSIRRGTLNKKCL